jgi:hypothetical protein
MFAQLPFSEWSVSVCTAIDRKVCYCSELGSRDQAIRLGCCTALYSSVQNIIVY